MVGNEGFDNVIRTEGGVLCRETSLPSSCVERLVYSAHDSFPRVFDESHVEVRRRTSDAADSLGDVGDRPLAMPFRLCACLRNKGGNFPVQVQEKSSR